LSASLIPTITRRFDLSVIGQPQPGKVAPEEIIVVDSDEGGSRFRRLDPEDLKDWLADYSIGELWEKNVIGYDTPPLYGVWASAPYFHNGSVPTIWDVLRPADRPAVWKRGLTPPARTKGRQI